MKEVEGVFGSKSGEVVREGVEDVTEWRKTKGKDVREERKP